MLENCRAYFYRLCSCVCMGKKEKKSRIAPTDRVHSSQQKLFTPKDVTRLRISALI